MSHSSYPRVGDTTRLQALRRVYDQWEKGSKSPEDLRASQDLAVLEAIIDQDKAGMDVATDGQIRWYDPISHLLRSREGVEINGLIRYYDTNFYVRQPVLKVKPVNGPPRVKDEYLYAASLTHNPVKAVLTGPLTLACHSIWSSSLFEGPADAAAALAKIVSAEVKALADSGAAYIQIDEPSLARIDIEMKRYKEIFKPIASARGKSKIILSVFFSDCSPLWPSLQELDVDILGLDFTYGTKLAAAIKSSGTHKGIAFGLVDGRNTRLENARFVADQLGDLAGKVRSGPVFLSTSCGLEFLPRDRAQAKLKLMKEVKSLLHGTD